MTRQPTFSKTPVLTSLYVPGDRPDMVDKAISSTADAVVIDLEDAVVGPKKQLARETAVKILSGPLPKPVYVRINGLGTPWAEDDVSAIRECEGLSGVRLPKISSASDVTIVDRWLGHGRDLEIQCLIESALGVEAAFEIASHRSVTSIGLGEADLKADIGVSDEAGLAWARSRIVVAARAASLPAPPQSVYPHIRDLDGLARSCRVGRGLGMFGRAAIHPDQLPIIVAAYLPSQTELDDANEVLRAAASAKASHAGSIALPDGRFVDAAVVAVASRTVMIADRHGTTA